MKPTAYFINVGRGELVDQRALTEALRDRRIAGAGARRLRRSSRCPPTTRCSTLDNVILTPALVGLDRPTSGRRRARAMAEGMLRAARGLVPENVVNPEVLDRAGFRREAGAVPGEFIKRRSCLPLLGMRIATLELRMSGPTNE